MQIAFNPGVLVGRSSPELSLVFSVVAGAPVPGTVGVSSIETRQRGRHKSGSHHRPDESGEVDAADLDTGDTKRNTQLTQYLDRHLPSGYDVLLEGAGTENEHIHVEHDPEPYREQ